MKRICNTLFGDFLGRDGDLIFEEISKNKFWDVHIKPVFDINYKHPVAIDIGAYCGFFTVYLSKKFQKVFAFEPQKHIYNLLCGNLYLNNCFNVDAFNLALYSRKCFMGIASPAFQGQRVQSNERNSNNGIDYDLIGNAAGLTLCEKIQSEATIVATTLDSFNFEDVGLIKIDTQGSDYNVLIGAVETIKKFRPVVVFEVEETPIIHEFKLNDYVLFFEKIGYKVAKLTRTRDDYIAGPCEKIKFEK